MSKPGESRGAGEDAESGGATNDPESGGAGNAADGTADAPRAVDRVDYDPDYDSTRPVLCDVCGAEMYYTAACKLKCTRCGYTRDCSDP